MTRRILLGSVAALLLLFVGLPLALLGVGAGSLSLAAGEGEAILNTLILALGTATLATVCGLPVGWVAARRQLHPRLEGALLLPYAVPPYVTTIAWIVLANPTNEVLTRWLPEIGRAHV